jgi:hypothetical protein
LRDHARVQIERRDSDGRAGPLVELSDRYSGLPSLTPTCEVATPQGFRAAAEIRVGDFVVTAGAVALPVVAIRTMVCDWRVLGLNPHLRPVRVPAGALGPGRPERELLLSPGCRLSGPGRTGPRAMLAADLAGQGRAACADGLSVTYIGLSLQRQARLMLRGVCCESDPRPAARPDAPSRGAA